MDSASHSSADADHPPSWLANVLGILIAVAALGFPIFAIAHFSVVDTEIPQKPAYPVVQFPE